MNTNHSSNKSVLIVEDDPAMCLGLSFVLRQAGFHVVTANDALQGVRLAAEKKPDLALLDVNMPAGGGFTVAEFWRRDPSLARNPIVFLTSNTSFRTKLRAAELGAAEFLVKPFEVDLVLSTVKSLVQPAQPIRTA
jgi:DNA-binding response OmpR family regulator